MKKTTNLWAFYKSINVLVLASLVFYTSMLGVFFVPNQAGAGAGAIWTTNSTCGEKNPNSQDLNQYNTGDWVWLRGRGFSAGTYNWTINSVGQGNPQIYSSSYTFTNADLDASGAFCFQAYQIKSGEAGVYKVTFDGNKSDNYKVGNKGIITVKKILQNDCTSSRFDFEIFNASRSFTYNWYDDDFHLYHNQQETFSNLDAGNYTVLEVTSTTHNTSVDCGSKGSASGNQLSFNLNDGDNVTCTFTNIKKAAAKIVKVKTLDSTTGQVAKGACYELWFTGSSCPYAGSHYSPMCDGGLGDLLDGIISWSQREPNCEYTFKMTQAPPGYEKAANQTFDPLDFSDPCVMMAEIEVDPLYATINVHKNVLSSNYGDIVDYTHFTSRVAGEDKTFYEGSPSNYTVLAKTTDVRELNANTNPNFMFEGCAIDTGHTTETLDNGIRILNIQEDDVINVTCTNRYRTSCGDGKTEDPNERGESEECDEGAQNGNICTPSYGGDDCTYCSATCQEITVPAPFCGDGITQLSEGEECDGDNPLSCDLNGYQGWIQCQNDCYWSECVQEEFCGDGDLNGPEECDDNNNVDGDGCSASCTIEYSQITGRKYYDKNADGIHYKDSDPTLDETRMNDWLIRLYDENWNKLDEKLTGHTGQIGQYKFDNLVMGTYYICEQIPMGIIPWVQTGPILDSHPVDFNDTQVNDAIAVENNSPNISQEFPVCWQVNITAGGTDYGWLKFGNYYPICGNSILDSGEECELNDTQTCTTSEGYAGLQSCNVGSTQVAFSINSEALTNRVSSCTWNPCETEEYCGDGIMNGLEECDGTDGITGEQTCSAECTIVEPEPEEKEPETDPVLTIIKSVESGTYYPGDTVNYIVTIKNEGTETAYDVRLDDTMPSGFTYDDGSKGAWLLGDLEVGKEFNHIYSVTIDSSVVAGSYTNTARVSAENHDPVTAQADVTVTARGIVLGAATTAGEEDELPQAGASLREYLLWLAGLAWLAFGAYGFRKLELKKNK